MTLPLDDFMSPDAHTPDFKRDQWGRPSIMQPNGKRKGYTRCSSAAKTIEDTFNLERHKRRNTVYGMAYDASLVARLIAIGGAPDTWDKAEKDQVNAIVEAADAVAKAHKRADIGTAIHHMTHRVDRGETVNAGPYQQDVDAYRAAMTAANLAVYPQYIECRMVNDDLEMAGTADRIVLYDSLDVYRIADIKTGATIDFGGLGWSAQLAAYAGGLLYDVTTEQRIETPPIDRKIGLIIHLPAGEGRCDIYEVNIAAGLEAARLANKIRATRKAAKTWITPATTTLTRSPATTNSGDSSNGSPTPSTAMTSKGSSSTPPTSTSTSTTSSDGPKADGSWRFEAKRRYDALNDTQRADYTARKQAIDTSDRDAVFRLLDEVEPFNYCPRCDAGGHECPGCGRSIPHGAFQCDTNCTGLDQVDPPTPPEEGGAVDQADVDALQRRFEALGTEAKLWTGTLIAQGNKAFPFRIRDAPSVRRYELYRAILALAELFYGGGT